MKPRITIQQKITVFTNIYKIFDVDESGSATTMRAYAQQKRLALKEKFTFYTDEQKTQALFTFRAEKVMDVHGRYIVEDMQGTVIGMFKKEFKQSLLNSTWHVLDAAGNTICIVRESNQWLAIARRFAGLIPVIGDIIEIMTDFLRYHFAFVDPATGVVVGKYQKTTLFRDHYTLHASDDMVQRIDWKLLAAMGVALDALQSR